MDFKSVVSMGIEKLKEDDPNGYYNLLKQFSTCSKIVISKIEGTVNAGGIGIVAASDIVIANETAVFSLSEMLFGLLPACVLPFLIRRVGFQKAKWLTLTTKSITSNKACDIGLVDEVANNVNEALRKNLLRLTRLESSTIKDAKIYMNDLWILNDDTQKFAVSKLQDLMGTEKVQSNLFNFVNHGKFPWDKHS